MTPEQALNRLDETVIGDLELKIALSKALEKQIPKKVVKHGFDPLKLISSVSYTCPSCNTHVSAGKWCASCGQAILWRF
jgi:hypothetical protein